jgi:PEP-CTERM motif
VLGSDLLVPITTGNRLAEYTTDGALVNPTLISEGLDIPIGIAVAPTPEPSSVALLGAGLAAFAFCRRRRSS